MNRVKSQKGRRDEIVLNYLSLIVLLFIFYYGKTHEFGYPLIGSGVFCLGIVYFTFNRLYMHTGLWKLTHSKIEKLDEREIQLTHNALRTSYSIFTVFILSFIFIIGLGVQNKINMLFDVEAAIAIIPINFIIFWYFAHILPASIIAWQVKEV